MIDRYQKSHFGRGGKTDERNISGWKVYEFLAEEALNRQLAGEQKELDALFVKYDPERNPLVARRKMSPEDNVIDREISERMVRKIDQGHGGKREASEYLASIGIAGLKYTDKRLHEKGLDAKHFTVFLPSCVTIVAVNGLPLEDQAKRREALHVVTMLAGVPTPEQEAKAARWQTLEPELARGLDAVDDRRPRDYQRRGVSPVQRSEPDAGSAGGYRPAGSSRPHREGDGRQFRTLDLGRACALAQGRPRAFSGSGRGRKGPYRRIAARGGVPARRRRAG